MTIQKVVLTILTLLTFIPSFAQDTHTLLYEVSGNDLAVPSYVFGTIHLMCPDDIQISEAVKEKVVASEQLVLEIDFGKPNIVQEMQQKVMLPEGKTLKDIMSAEDYATLSTFFQDSLMTPISAVERFSPVALYSMLAMQMLHCQPGSYEMSLIQLAKAEQKEIAGLETIDEQMAAFNKISEEGQVDLLTEAIDDYDQALSEFQQLLDAYQAQDVDKLYEVSLESMDEIEGMEQYLLIDRNEAWLPTMESSMKEQSTFFAVGAGHLGGERGLLELLEEQGYTVTPVQ